MVFWILRREPFKSSGWLNDLGRKWANTKSPKGWMSNRAWGWRRHRRLTTLSLAPPSLPPSGIHRFLCSVRHWDQDCQDGHMMFRSQTDFKNKVKRTKSVSNSNQTYWLMCHFLRGLESRYGTCKKNQASIEVQQYGFPLYLIIECGQKPLPE